MQLQTEKRNWVRLSVHRYSRSTHAITYIAAKHTLKTKPVTYVCITSLLFYHHILMIIIIFKLD